MPSIFFDDLQDVRDPDLGGEGEAVRDDWLPIISVPAVHCKETGLGPTAVSVRSVIIEGIYISAFCHSKRVITELYTDMSSMPIHPEPNETHTQTHARTHTHTHRPHTHTMMSRTLKGTIVNKNIV